MNKLKTYYVYSKRKKKLISNNKLLIVVSQLSLYRIIYISIVLNEVNIIIQS